MLGDSNDQAQAVDEVQEAETPLDRMMKFADREDLPEEAEGEPEVEAAEGVEPEEAAPEEESEEITHDGEIKKMTKTALKELAQQGFDYTKKTQQLADERKFVAEQHRQANEQAQFQNQFIGQLTEAKALETQLAQYRAVNWQQLAADDPMQYLTLNQTHQELKEQYQAKVSEINQLHGQAQQTQAQNQTALLQREAQAMMQAIPEWKDSGKATAEMSDLKQYLAKAGFVQQEVDGIFDHRHVTVARKAMLYDKMMNAGQKKVAAVLPTVKPGNKQPTSHTAMDKDMRQRLRQTGNADYAVKLIERML